MGELTSIVVVEERVRPGTVDEDILRVDDPHTPSVSAVALDTVAVLLKVGVQQVRVHGERLDRVGNRLVVPSSQQRHG